MDWDEETCAAVCEEEEKELSEDEVRHHHFLSPSSIPCGHKEKESSEAEAPLGPWCMVARR